MSGAGQRGPDLSGLVGESRASSHDVDGFHWRHAAGADRVEAIARAFSEAGYFLEMITCEDRRADEGTMRLVYTYCCWGEADRHVVFVDVAGEIPGAEAPSVSGVFAGANWHEREVYDMYGVVFSGHPNLKRLLLPEDADFHALLKDFGRVEDAIEGGG